MKKPSRYLPFMHFTIHSDKAPSDIHSILSTNTFSLSDLVHYDESKPFIGTMQNDRFCLYLKPSPFVRNAFSPVIKGTVQETQQGSDITITVRPTLFSIVFMSFWLGCVLFAFLFSLFNMIFDTAQKDIILLFGSAAMFVCGYLLIQFAFLIPANKVQDILYAILCEKNKESSLQ